MSLNMIRYKGIVHERVEDAPFVGALVAACGCSLNCKNCFNAHLKCAPIQGNTPEGILDAVTANPFNEGVIFSGLEWSEQPEELVALVSEAFKRKLPVMVYTGLSLKAFFARVPDLMTLKGGLYIKYGSYRPELAISTHMDQGVTLASDNQKIAYFNLAA